MTENGRGQQEVPRDVALQEAFDAFLHQTQVPLDFHARVMGRVQQQRARRGRWARWNRWWTWWTQAWSPRQVWVATVCGLLSLALNVGLGSYAWQHRHAVTSLGQALSATQAQVQEVQAERRQWQARQAELTDTLATLQAQRAAPQEPLTAQGTEVPRVDRSLLDQADAAFHQGRYDEAIAAYSAVIRAEPTNSRAYLQAGRAYAAKGRYNDAVAAFNEALRLAKASPEGMEIVPVVEAMLREMQPQVLPPPMPVPPEKYKLTVRAVPADSTVKLENSTTAYRPGLEVLPGSYVLVVSRYGYKTARRQVTVSKADITLDIVLDQEKYQLTVQATPADSIITFDKSPLVYRPGMELPPGRYDFVVTRDGYKTARRTVTVSKTDISLPVPLEPEKYKLTVRATPADSTVQLDKSTLEYRPGMEMAPGLYELTVSRDGYKPAHRTITVSTADVTLDVALEGEKTYKMTVQAVPADSTVKFANSKREYRPGMEVEQGPYELIVTHEGYKPARKQVTVSTADVTLDVALEMIHYQLTVQATPADSTIKFDNSKLEYHPGMDLVPGRYDLVVSHEGYKPARKQVTVSTADVTLAVTLEPEKYTLIVQATPADSTVKFANSKREYRPGMEVEQGPYELIVTHEGYKPARKQVTVSTADVTLHVALEPDKPQRPPLGDTTPPHIALDQESIPKTVPPAQSRVTIIGRATDDSGVAEVAVNGKKAELGADGTFTAEVLLRYGDNPIHVRAIAINGNAQEESLTIYRKDEPVRPPPGERVTLPSPPSTRRLALLIGNAKYKISPLGNAVNDARDMSVILKKLGFETTLLINATRQEMDEAIDAFTRELRQGGVGVFYYAGHGVQIDGQNYLVPVDAPLELAANVKYNSVAANELLERMADAENGLNIIILDACRDNAFTREWRSARRGLAPPPFAQGALIAYSTAPGEVAWDGAEGSHNGVYTKYLLKHITQRGLTVEGLLKKVRDEVQRETKGQQIPWESSSLVGEFYFAAPK